MNVGGIIQYEPKASFYKDERKAYKLNAFFRILPTSISWTNASVSILFHSFPFQVRYLVCSNSSTTTSKFCYVCILILTKV